MHSYRNAFVSHPDWIVLSISCSSDPFCQLAGMSLVLEDMGNKVSLQRDGKTISWHIPSKEICTVQGRCFVKLNTTSYTLNGMVRAQSSAAPGETNSSYKSLRDNLGLQSLLDKRNDAQRKTEGSPDCTLFADEESQSQAPAMKKRKWSKPSDEEHEILTIDIDDASSIQVLSASHPKDMLYVEFDEECISAVLAKLWSSEWDDSGSRKRNHALPKGVRRQRGKFVVKVSDDLGKLSLKFFQDAESAAAAATSE